MDSLCDWRITKKGVLARGQYLLDSGQWSDCKFLVGEILCQELLEAHKLYLASSSPVFETMFFGSIPEGNEPIEVPDVEAEAFKAMLKFVYTDELPVLRLELARDIYYCAKKYMLLDLIEKCSNYMKSILSPETVCKIYEIAELFEESELLKQCFNLMRTETKKILTDKSWADAPMATVSVLFEQDTLAIDSENDLYEALLVWSKAECQRKSLPTDQKSLRSVADDFLNKIRFFTMTPEEFANGPGKAEILEKDEILAVLLNLLSSNRTIFVPPDFSLKKNHLFKPDGKKQVGRATPIRLSAHGSTFKVPQSTEKYYEHLYCQRDFIQNSYCNNDGKLRCCLSFRVDTRIQIRGIRVSTQITTDFSEPENSYLEKLIAILHNSDDDEEINQVSGSFFYGKAIYNKTVKIRFKRVITLDRHKDCRIYVVFRKSGKYPAGNISRASACEGVNFSFYHESSTYNIQDYLIRGIIFSKL